MLDPSFDGLFSYEELRIRVGAYVGEKLAGRELDESNANNEDVNAVQRPSAS